MIWDPKAEHLISAKTHHMRVDYSMFEGFQVRGNARQVFSRGEVIVEEGQFVGRTGRGQYLRRAAQRRRMGVAPGESGVSRIQPLQRRPRARSAREAHLGHLQLRLAVGGHERLHSHLHAGVRIDRRRHELVAGHWHNSARQSDRAGSDAAERARGREVRHPVSGAGARFVRSARRECSRRACARWWLADGSASKPGSAARPSIPCCRCCGLGRLPSAWTPWICFFLFWLLNMAVIWRGIETIKYLEGIGAPFMLAVGLLLLWWITRKAGGLGPVLQHPEQIPNDRRIRALLRSVAHRHGGLLGHRGAEHSRFHPLREIAEGADARPGAGTARRHDALFVHRRRGDFRIGGALRPGHLGSGGAARRAFNQPVVASIALVALLVATLNTNVAANVVSPSNDFSNLNPRLISFRTGGLITGVVGVLMMPWKLLTDFQSYIFGWLVGYSGLLGPIAGIMIADYFLLRRTYLDVGELYDLRGIYRYGSGVNYRAIAALVAGMVVALIGLVVPPLRWLYDYAWFVGFLVASVTYWISMRGRVGKTLAPALSVNTHT